MIPHEVEIQGSCREVIQETSVDGFDERLKPTEGRRRQQSEFVESTGSGAQMLFRDDIHPTDLVVLRLSKIEGCR